jgi:chromosome condensin MukBEF complex kleisin-like MukF subunit
MPKPMGSIGSTKKKILAIIYKNCKEGEDCYGYSIWQCLKENFLIYLNDCDIRNVYHHLNDLCEMNYIHQIESGEEDNRTLYRIAPGGLGIRDQYQQYLEILNEK